MNTHTFTVISTERTVTAHFLRFDQFSSTCSVSQVRKNGEIGSGGSVHHLQAGLFISVKVCGNVSPFLFPTLVSTVSAQILPPTVLSFWRRSSVAFTSCPKPTTPSLPRIHVRSPSHHPPMYPTQSSFRPTLDSLAIHWVLNHP